MRERLLVGRAGIGGLQVSVDLADVAGPGVGLWYCRGCVRRCCRVRWCGKRGRWCGRGQYRRRGGHQGQARGREAEGWAGGQVRHLLDAVKGFVGTA